MIWKSYVNQMVEPTGSKDGWVQLLGYIGSPYDDDRVLKSDLSLLVSKSVDFRKQLGQDSIGHI